MKIKITTKPYGEIEINEVQIFDFPDGILGFDFIKKFAIIDAQDEGSPFKWLQAVEERELAFVIMQPDSFMSNYHPVIAPGDLEALKVESLEELLVFAIVTIPENPAEMTANLQGPLLLNVKEHIGRQAILSTDEFKVRHGILQEMNKLSGTGG